MIAQHQHFYLNSIAKRREISFNRIKASLLHLIEVEKTMIASANGDCVRERQKEKKQKRHIRGRQAGGRSCGPTQKQSQRRPVCSAQGVPQSQPFRDPGMCPQEVQAGQLSVENKLLPCFQALQQTNYNTHTFTHTHLTLHPTLSSLPPPLC